MALPTAKSRVGTWFSRERWAQRLITFHFSWFVVTMSTGVVPQVLTNIPYPAQWLRTIAYCIWVLDIVLFLFFLVLTCIRCLVFPAIARTTFQDFSQTSYLGAIPVTIDSIAVGLIIFYSDRPAAVWAAYGLFWLATSLSVIVGCFVVFFVCAYQEPPDLSSITAVWLISYIPFIVTAGTGSVLAPYLNPTNEMTTLIVSFLEWALGITMCFIISTVYYWRLTRCKLPVREAIVSCFIPMGPTGMGAYGIQNLAVATSQYIEKQRFFLHRSPSTFTDDAALSATGQAIHWIGIFIALFFVAVSSFWFIQAWCSVLAHVPKRFNVGFWSFVFPNGVYSNALCRLADDLNNSGFRGFAATCVTITTLLWLGCALLTLYKGIWCAELFFAPGLEGWNEKRALERVNSVSKEAPETICNEDCQVVQGDLMARESRADGTYATYRLSTQKAREDLERSSESNVSSIQGA